MVFGEELIFWPELYFYVPDLHLLSILGLHSDSALRQILIEFHHQTLEVFSNRALSNFVRMLDEYYYLMSSQERESMQLGRLMELTKLPSETWLPFGCDTSKSYRRWADPHLIYPLRSYSFVRSNPLR